MIRWLLLLALALWITVLVLVLAGYAKADEPVRVTPGLVCAVQRAIKLHRQPAWTLDRCERVANVLNDLRAAPLRMTSICVAESDLNERAIRGVRTGVFDVGLCGVRCVTDDDGYCTNGEVRGIIMKNLLDPATNIRAADRVLAEKDGNLLHYNGGTREHGYEARIHAIEAALSGSVVKTGTPRMEKLVRQIAKAVRP